ncbi:MAG: hypothetical protein R2991_10260 [Thermoanaerobaculia bacterium]
MHPSDVVASIGVTLLLAAFALNLFGALPRASRAYQALNLLGAGMAAWAAWHIGFLPFVILEGSWAAVALVGLLRPLGAER